MKIGEQTQRFHLAGPCFSSAIDQQSSQHGLHNALWQSLIVSAFRAQQILDAYHGCGRVFQREFYRLLWGKDIVHLTKPKFPWAKN